jgi:hypothetical protein
MAANTCMSVIEYESVFDLNDEPFLSERMAQAEQMFNEGKTAEYPNWAEPSDSVIAKRYWIDHAAAQEFIDFVLLNAPSHRINIVSTSIEDL